MDDGAGMTDGAEMDGIDKYEAERIAREDLADSMRRREMALTVALGTLSEEDKTPRVLMAHAEELLAWVEKPISSGR